MSCLGKLSFLSGAAVSAAQHAPHVKTCGAPMPIGEYLPTLLCHQCNVAAKPSRMVKRMARHSGCGSPSRVRLNRALPSSRRCKMQEPGKGEDGRQDTILGGVIRPFMTRPSRDLHSDASWSTFDTTVDGTI